MAVYRISIELESKGTRKSAAELDDVGKAGARAALSLGKLAATTAAGLGLAIAAREAAKLTQSLVALGRESLTLFSEQETAQRRVEAAIKATGGAAGLTAGELAKMARELQATTGVADEVILQNEAIALSFKSVTGDTFEPFLRTAINMSQVLGTDLKASILQVGKALEDPIRGTAQLSEVSVSLTQAEQEKIKALAESNQLSEAQGEILRILNGQFPDAAEQTGTWAYETGQLALAMKDAQTAVGEFLEAGLVPFVQEATAGLQGSVEAWTSWRFVVGTSLAAAALEITGYVTRNLELFRELAGGLAAFLAKIPGIGETYAAGFRAAEAVLEGFQERVARVGVRIASNFQKIADDALLKNLGIDADRLGKQFEQAGVDTEAQWTKVLDVFDALAAKLKRLAELQDSLKSDLPGIITAAEITGITPTVFAGRGAGLNSSDEAERLEAILRLAGESFGEIPGAVETLVSGVEDSSNVFVRAIQRAGIDFSRSVEQVTARMVGQLSGLVIDFLSEFNDERAAEFESEEARASREAGLTLTKDTTQEQFDLGRDVARGIFDAWLGEGFGQIADLFFQELFQFEYTSGLPTGDFFNPGNPLFDVTPSSPNSQFTLSFQDGQFGSTDFSENKRDLEQIMGLADSITDTLNSFIAAIGGTIEDFDRNLQFVEENGLFSLRSGGETIREFGSNLELALNTILAEAFLSADITGVPQQMLDALRASADEAIASGNFEQFFQDMGIATFVANFQGASGRIRQATQEVAAGVADAAEAIARMGGDIDAISLFTEGAFSGIKENILGPISQFLPDLTRWDLIFKQVRAQVQAYNQALLEQIVALEAAGQAAGHLREQLIDEALIDQAEQQARRSGRGRGDRRQREEAAAREFEALQRLAGGFGPAATSAFSLLDRISKLREEMEKLGKDTTALAGIQERIAQQGLDAFISELDLIINPALASSKALADLREKWADQVIAQQLLGGSVDELNAKYEEAVGVLKGQLGSNLASDAGRFAVAMLNAAGRTEEAAELEWELNLAANRLTLAELKARQLILEQEGIIVEGLSDLIGLAEEALDQVADAGFTFQDAVEEAGRSFASTIRQAARDQVTELLDALNSKRLEVINTNRNPLEALVEEYELFTDRIFEIVNGIANRTQLLNELIRRGVLPAGSTIVDLMNFITGTIDELRQAELSNLVEELLEPIRDLQKEILGDTSAPGKIFDVFGQQQQQFLELQAQLAAGTFDIGSVGDTVDFLRGFRDIAGDFLSPTGFKVVEQQILQLLDAIGSGSVNENGIFTPGALKTEFEGALQTTNVTLFGIKEEMRGIREDLRALLRERNLKRSA